MSNKHLLHSKWACRKQSLLVLQPELLSLNRWVCNKLLLPLPLLLSYQHLLLLLNKVEHNKVLLPWLKLKLNGLTTPTGGIILAFMDTSALPGTDHGVDLTSTATAADIDDYHTYLANN